MTALYKGSCLQVMSGLPDGSADLILTDPPYNLANFMADRSTNLKQMRPNFFGSAGWDSLPADEWLLMMDQFFGEADRVLKKGGSMIMFMAVIKVESIIELARKHGFYYKTTGVWHKLNPMPRNKNLQFVNSIEAWLYFTHGTKTGTFNNGGALLHDFFETPVAPAGERTFCSHPTQKPEALFTRFVEILSNPGDTVLDPFMGSGTTGAVCRHTGRSFTGIELDEQYFEAAKRRIESSGGEQAQ